MTTSSEHPVGRRGLLLGGGAAALAAGALGRADRAEAQPARPDGDGTAAGRLHPNDSPITTTIASAPISAFTYRTVCMYDFRPFNPAAQPTWGGNGVYPGVVGTTMRATVEIPPGALVQDVEYYVYNNSGSDFLPDSHIYVPGHGSISSIGASVVIPSTGTITASRAPVTQTGPYPIGARLLVSLTMPSTGAIQVNGARVGFQVGAAGTGLLPRPFRAYDSRVSGGKIAANSTRTVTLPASIVPSGTTGVLVNITATDASAEGFLKVSSAAAAEPAASALNYPAHSSIANAMTVAVSSGRQLHIKASSAVHVIVDVTGTIA